MNLNLPLGIQTFSEIIQHNFLYVDKTRQIHSLITAGKYYFIARPRRFGKSLTLSTIKSIYSGERELFEGLWIHDQWDWDRIHPVIHISFSSLGYGGLGLETAIRDELARIAKGHDIALRTEDISQMFRQLIQDLSSNGQVILLIDEYDKPIIDYLTNVEQARKNQEILKRFYSVIKDSDPYLRFLLITGVSKFSKVSIFSDLNNLQDITFHRKFSTLVGYTQEEVEHYFGTAIAELADENDVGTDEQMALVRKWYNGYSWDSKNYVYNPFSLMSYIDAGEFRNFWFETGTPTFLLKLMREQQVYKLDNLTVSEQAFSSYDIEHLQILPILFQTGYLTIKSKGDFGIYTLDYPNNEVKEALLSYIISDLRNEQTALTKPMVIQLYGAFRANDLEEVIKLVKSIFKNIPSHIFLNRAEAYYHSLLYLVFYYLGQYIESEVSTSDGRLDSVVKTDEHIYILEFKLDQSAEAALKQIKDRGYAEKYAADERPKVLVGINFRSESKTVDGWLSETQS